MNYELTVLLKKEEDIKIIREIINSLKGKIQNEENWGEKLLAYPIKKNKKAFYFNLTIEINKNDVKALRQKLNFETQLIRYLLLVKN